MSDLKKILALVGCAAVVLIFIVFAAIWLGFHRGDPGKYRTGNFGGSCSILFPVSAGTDEQIGKVLNDYINKYAPANSPLKGKGLLIAQGARRSQVNPALIVAIARKETSFGIAGSGIRDGSHNSFGRTAATGQPNVGRWYKWSDPDGDGPLTGWDASLYGDDDESAFIKRVYVDGAKITTIEGLINKYAPPSENNTQEYIQQMTDWYNEMARMGNGVVLGPECIGGALATGKWIWPVDGRITSRFGVDRGSHTHEGLDIDTPDTPAKPDVKAVDNGIVSDIHLNTNNKCGVYIYINHSGGLRSLYCHLAKDGIQVSEGQEIHQGDIIALSDNTGTSTTGSHLHLGARLNGVFVNPENYLPKR